MKVYTHLVKINMDTLKGFGGRIIYLKNPSKNIALYKLLMELSIICGTFVLSWNDRINRQVDFIR